MNSVQKTAILPRRAFMPVRRQAAATPVHNDFRTHVEGGWHGVDPAVRARMDRLLTNCGATTFVGTGSVRRSRIGWLFAQLCRLWGAPLVFRQGENVKTVVRVAPTANGLRCWHRLFKFEDGASQLVETTKVVDARLGILDATGAQGERMLATRMRVWAAGRSLHFRSTGYFLRLAGFNLAVPMLLTPGILHAEHRDLGDGSFRYILSFEHPLWGVTFYQDGLFRMMD